MGNISNLVLLTLDSVVRNSITVCLLLVSMKMLGSSKTLGVNLGVMKVMFKSKNPEKMFAVSFCNLLIPKSLNDLVVLKRYLISDPVFYYVKSSSLFLNEIF